jgi:hypothetical protein
MPTHDKRPDLQNTLIPVEQASISFYGHELVAVRLEDGRIAEQAGNVPTRSSTRR